MHCFFPLGIHCPLCCMLSKQSAPSKSTHLVPNGDTDSTPRLSRGVLSALDRVGGLHGRPVMSQTMRHRWLLLGACGWVLLILMFASKFISFRTTDDYGEKSIAQSGTLPVPVLGNKVVVATPLPGPEVPAVSVTTNLPSPLPSATDWLDVSEKRLELLSAVCKNASGKTREPVNKFVMDRIFVCDKHKILFCQTPKVGNTQWKKVLIVLNGDYPTVDEVPEDIVHRHDKNHLRRLSSFTPSEISERLRLYFKFLIVRDPFERLISAFKDKFVENPRFEPWYKTEIAPAIIRRYRRDRRVAAGATAPAAGLRFREFVRYLGDTDGRRRHLDYEFGEAVIHWATYSELCAPCQIGYSAVGHHETLERDVPHILRGAGVEALVEYPAIPPGITRYNRTKVEQYFAGVSGAEVRKLYARYQGDFLLFGYPPPNFLWS
ncbi:carbohydrate sulfotransferase 10 isoform X1 [Gadus morhua]|uniref:Carbohydrate sulfotransferase n=2 Tax=Gadus morhua TaxID=8049 RepID=A0A8C5BKL0_GADMO|nr:carbohydrate sulfotransferase 10-like isoform X1 [Gadus morhua]